MDESKRKTRRRHDSELKASVLAECDAPSASVAKVAMSHGLNANLVHKWRREALRSQAPVTSVASPVGFVPVTLPSECDAMSAIRIDLRRGQTSISVSWPRSAATECGAWLRELLR